MVVVAEWRSRFERSAQELYSHQNIVSGDHASIEEVGASDATSNASDQRDALAMIPP